MHESDPLAIEEAALHLMQRTMFLADSKTAGLDKKTTARHKAMTDALCLLLTEQLGENLQLSNLARQINTSSYHLCRVFRRQTGKSIHKYRTQLRLVRALSLLPELDNMSQVAFELGFSSHSHFSSAFYKAYSCSPKNYLDYYKNSRTIREHSKTDSHNHI